MTANLSVLGLALVILAAGSVAGALAIVCERPRLAVVAAAVRLAAFWPVAPPLVAWQGSLGAAMAVLLGAAVHVLIVAFGMRDVLGGVLAGWTAPVLLGLLAIPLGLVRSSWPVELLVACGFVALYGGALLALRVITVDELRTVSRALLARRAEAGP